MDDPNSDGLFALFEIHFGEAIYNWPWPLPVDRQKLTFETPAETRINHVLAIADLPAIDDGFRRRFHEEIRFGQIDEDAGGFLWRCWCRAMQQPNVFLDRYGRGYQQTAAAA